jgi:hypothetical protein
MNTLILLHSITRYLVMIALLGVIIQSLVGVMQSKPYGKLENKAGLYLFIFTHIQLLLGLILFFGGSKAVIFSGASMKDPIARYWLVEHSLMMLIAIVLITMARITAKKMTSDAAKHKRLFIFNSLAFVIIIIAISMSQRGFIGLPE